MSDHVEGEKIIKKKKKKKRGKSKGLRYGDWVQKVDPNSGKFYYGNVKTLERVWVMPAEFKVAQENDRLGSPELQSSLDEEEKDGNDSSKDGSFNDSDDVWLEGYDPNNKRKYYVNKITGESRWTRPLSLNAVDINDWISGRDPKTKRTYYFNKKTKETTWEKPPGYEDPDDKASSPSAATAPNEADAEVLKAAASRRKDQAEEREYHTENERSGVVHTKAPVHERKIRATSKSRDKNPEWVSSVDPETGKTYYCNTETNETTWAKPQGLAVLEDAAQTVPPLEPLRPLEPSESSQGNQKYGSHERRISQEMKELEKLQLSGIINERTSELQSSNTSKSSSIGNRGTHRQQMSVGAKEARKIISELGRGQSVSERRNSIEGSDHKNSSSCKPGNHARTVSSIENFKEISDDVALALSRPQNGVIPAFNKLVEGDMDTLYNSLMDHRIRLGGATAAPLRDLVQMLGASAGDAAI